MYNGDPFIVMTEMNVSVVCFTTGLTTKVLRPPLVCERDRSKRPGSTAPSSPRHSPQSSLVSGDESWHPFSSTDTRLEMTGSTASLAHTCWSSHSCGPGTQSRAFVVNCVTFLFVDVPRYN